MLRAINPEVVFVFIRISIDEDSAAGHDTLSLLFRVNYCFGNGGSHDDCDGGIVPDVAESYSKSEHRKFCCAGWNE
jgi:hypothetical protein